MVRIWVRGQVRARVKVGKSITLLMIGKNTGEGGFSNPNPKNISIQMITIPIFHPQT